MSHTRKQMDMLMEILFIVFRCIVSCRNGCHVFCYSLYKTFKIEHISWYLVDGRNFCLDYICLIYVHKNRKSRVGVYNTATQSAWDYYEISTLFQTWKKVEYTWPPYLPLLCTYLKECSSERGRNKLHRKLQTSVPVCLPSRVFAGRKLLQIHGEHGKQRHEMINGAERRARYARVPFKFSVSRSTDNK